MSDSTLVGVVHLIEPTKTYGQKGFRKRLVVLEQDSGRFTNFIPIDFIQEGCDSVDDLSVGQKIKVTYRLSGRKWQKDAASEVKYFLSAEATGFQIQGEKSGDSGNADISAAPAPDENEAGDWDDDVPF